MSVTSRLREWTLRLAGTFRRTDEDGDLEEELRFHLAMETEENLEHGMSRDEAERVARIGLGGVAQIKEAYRDQRGLPTVETVFSDVRYGFRLLRRSPVLTTVAVVSLALGMAIVNEAFVDRFMKGAHPLGRVVEEIPHEQEPRVLEIIGIVEDALYRSMREPAPPTIYIPFSQAEPRHLRATFFNVVVRPSVGTPMNLAPGVAAAISDVDQDLSLTLRSMDDRVRAHFNQEKVLAVLGSAFGGLALLLAAVGLYGVIFYAVARRQTEIAIRMALGANRRHVVGTVLGRAAKLVATGVVVGWVVSYWVVESVQSLLFGLPAREPRLFVAAAAVLVVVVAIAAWSPARRACKLDPSEVLREG